MKIPIDGKCMKNLGLVYSNTWMNIYNMIYMSGRRTTSVKVIMLERWWRMQLVTIKSIPVRRKEDSQPNEGGLRFGLDQMMRQLLYLYKTYLDHVLNKIVDFISN